jgi:hypothetical protein
VFRLAAALLAAALAAGCEQKVGTGTGPGPTPDPRPAPTPDPDAPLLPARAAGPGVEVAVYSVQEAEALLAVVAPGSDRLLVVADVEVTNTGRPGLRCDPEAFRVRDGQGREAAAVPQPFDGALAARELPAGGKARGRVAFLVPTDAGLTLLFHPLGMPAPVTVKVTK